MSSSDSPVDLRLPLVTDTSVVINLNATASAAAIIGAFPNPFVVTEAVRRELSGGQAYGSRCRVHQPAALLSDVATGQPPTPPRRRPLPAPSQPLGYRRSRGSGRSSSSRRPRSRVASTSLMNSPR